MIVENYQEVNGTFYKKDTDKKVVNVLERVRKNNSRIRIYLGDRKTGRSWNEEYNTMGYVGRSTGSIKIPLLIYNSNSSGGLGILDNCIVKIVDTRTKRSLYEHENFHTGNFETVKTEENNEYPYGVTIDGKEHANFESPEKAKRHIDFMTGKRNSK